MGAIMNKTLLLTLLARCREDLLKELENQEGTSGNATTAAPSQTRFKSTRQSYDNAYFYILFVMFFYSFLAFALFIGFVHYDNTKKDSTDATVDKYDEESEKFEFEEEESII